MVFLKPKIFSKISITFPNFSQSVNSQIIIRFIRRMIWINKLKKSCRTLTKDSFSFFCRDGKKTIKIFQYSTFYGNVTQKYIHISNLLNQSSFIHIERGKKEMKWKSWCRDSLFNIICNIKNQMAYGTFQLEAGKVEDEICIEKKKIRVTSIFTVIPYMQTVSFNMSIHEKKSFMSNKKFLKQ